MFLSFLLLCSIDTGFYCIVITLFLAVLILFTLVAFLIDVVDLHVLDKVFADISARPAIPAILRSLYYRAPVILQSMLIFKQPRIGGKGITHSSHLP
jgi:hypothetical protein